MGFDWSAVRPGDFDLRLVETDVARDRVEGLQLVMHLDLKPFLADLHARIEQLRRPAQFARVADIYLAFADATALRAGRVGLTVDIEAVAATRIERVIVSSLKLGLHVFRFGPLICVAVAPAVAAAQPPVLHEVVRVGRRNLPVPL